MKAEAAAIGTVAGPHGIEDTVLASVNTNDVRVLESMKRAGASKMSVNANARELFGSKYTVIVDPGGPEYL